MELHGFAAGLPREAVHRQLARSAGVSQPSHASPATARPQTLAALFEWETTVLELASDCQANRSEVHE